MTLSSGDVVQFPAVYRRIKENKSLFFLRMGQEDPSILHGRPTLDFITMSKQLQKWADRVSQLSPVGYDISMDALKTYFWGNGRYDNPWWVSEIQK